MPSCREFDALVTPYVDGVATNAGRAVVEAHLAACPPCRQRAAAETSARDTLRARLCRPCAPDDLRVRCLAASRARRSLGTFFIAASLLLAGGGVLVYVLTRLSPTVLAAQLMLDHVKCFAVGQPTSPVEAGATEQQFERDHGWVVRLPRVAVAGLELVAVRQCFCAQGGATAHAMYRFEGRPVSLYILPDVNRARATAGVFAHDALIWSRDGNTYVLLGQETDAAMQRLAAELNQGL
jgi:anti-sigma factor RsiW